MWRAVAYSFVCLVYAGGGHRVRTTKEQLSSSSHGQPLAHARERVLDPAQLLSRCTSCSYGQRHWSSREQLLDPLQVLSALLLAATPAAGWQVPGAVFLRHTHPKVVRGAAALATLHATRAARPIMTETKVAKDGDEVLVRYTGKLEDGQVFDSNADKEPMTVAVGAGQLIPGLETALRGMAVGERKELVLPPEQAFGDRDESKVFRLPVDQLPAGAKKGMMVNAGQVPAMIADITDTEVVIDANPALAGKTLTFDIELVQIKDPPLRGLDMIGWGGQTVQVPTALTDSPVSKVFDAPNWPAAWPYSDADFSRQDESDDSNFYSEPRFVTHIDDGAVGAIRNFYATQFKQAPQGEYSVLDICSSWISHYPKDLQAKRVAITGMVEAELAKNEQATEYVVRNLNVDPKLPYGDNEFDFVTNVVSVDYLNKPREIFKELHRVLKPGGVAIMSFSNRCFFTKAIRMWVADMSDGPGHCQIVGNYFHFNPEGGWVNVSSADISPAPGRTDPMWVVTAVKS